MVRGVEEETSPIPQTKQGNKPLEVVSCKEDKKPLKESKEEEHQINQKHDDHELSIKKCRILVSRWPSRLEPQIKNL